MLKVLLSVKCDFDRSVKWISFISDLKTSISDKKMSCFEMNVGFIHESELTVDLSIVKYKVLSLGLVQIEDHVPTRLDHDIIIVLRASIVRPIRTVTPKFEV
jgi:hypothetical protein